MCKYKIELWKIRRLNQFSFNGYDFCSAYYPYEEVEVSETEYYYSDNLVEVLQFLKSKRVFYVNLNRYHPGEYNLDDMDLWNNECYLANVYHCEEKLKFHKVDVYKKDFPNYTACGYKIKNIVKTKKIKHNYRNFKHGASELKDYSCRICEAEELKNLDYDIFNKDVIKLKKKPCVKESWFWNEEIRSRNSMSWKNQKKRRQWQ